jgi:CheY-like chemotaxis protein
MNVPVPPPRVLIVDDDADTREMYTWSLNAKGFDVLAVATGLNAIAEARAVPPDVIVTDFTLPGMTGLELASRVKQAPEISVPVVLLSGRQFSGADEQRLLDSCEKILLKPILPDTLAEEILRVVTIGTARRLRRQLRQVRTRLGDVRGSVKSQRDIARDILALAEETQRESKRRAAVLVADDNAHYVAVNDAACEVTGLGQDELLAKSVWDITPGQLIADARSMWDDFIRRGFLEGPYSLEPPGGKPVMAWFSAIANIAPRLHVSMLSPLPPGQPAPPAR